MCPSSLADGRISAMDAGQWFIQISGNMYVMFHQPYTRNMDTLKSYFEMHNMFGVLICRIKTIPF